MSTLPSLEEMNKVIHDQGHITESNLPIRMRNKILNWRCDVPHGASQQSKSEEQGLLPPTETEGGVTATHKHLESDIRQFLDHLLSTDGHRKHGSGVVLVLGVFDHGHEQKDICVVGVNAEREAEFRVPEDTLMQLLSAMRNHLDLGRSHVAMDETSLDPPFMPPWFNAAAAKAALTTSPPLPCPSSPLSPLATLSPLSSDIDVVPETEACPTEQNSDSDGDFVMIDATYMSPAGAVPSGATSECGPLSREVIKRALIAAFPHAAVIETEDLHSTEQSPDCEDFIMLDSGDNNDSEAATAESCRHPCDLQKATKPSRSTTASTPHLAPPPALATAIFNANSLPHANSTPVNAIRRSSARFGPGYTHRVISSMNSKEST
ncbi:hypothetical protein BDN72DRAFT_905540 [Pluteus cervinus]|uniref:Uncharacterized protein n=1 Tax=Pluteus cervinus TaxID=181527 RepID=A0ACD3A3D1_9AGAR|nr:hypothetical protein BDN72DRAFT_905540 [Pluteus cervinus]